MDPEAAAFLRLIAKTLLVGFVWLALTCVFAIKGDNAFVKDAVKMGNVLFYAWLVGSIVLLVWVYKKMWSKKLSSSQDV